MLRTRRALLAALTALTAVPAFCSPGSARAYTPPRLDDGRPDLQGIWVAYNRTPLARPDSLTELYITVEQAREIEARGNARERDLSIPNETPEFFDERRVALIAGKLRSSIIIDPADGKIPGTPLMREKVEALRVQNRDDMDGPERRPLWERCLSSWAAHAPMLAVGFTNLHQIVQTRHAVVFFSESLHDARIFRLGGRHPPAVVDSFAGASIARWDGDTLEVETRNFKADQNRAGDFLVSSQKGSDLRRRLPRRELLAQAHPRRRPSARRHAALTS